MRWDANVCADCIKRAGQIRSFQLTMIEQQQDATWKRIQLNTFTRWVRQKLEQVNVAVSDLETDFEEGLKLIRLVEVLSGKSFGRHNKKVIFRHQKLENISLALQFLENEEHIKLVNIDSSAIADRNLKLILGLVWTLILHYSISKQVWDHPSGQLGNGEMSAKEKLLTWLRAKLPVELSVTNFTFDWNDGILLGALVDSCAPDLEVGWRKWLPSQALQSTLTAMRLASDYLGVTALIEPEELISPAVDEKSVMTYLSQFPGAKYTPLLGRLHDVVLTPVVGVSTIFKLQTRDAMIVPEIIIKGPNGSSIRCIQRQLSETVYEFRYQPETPGEHEIMATVHDIASGDSAKLARTKVVAVEGTDISSILVDGLNNETVIVGQRKDIVIDIGNLIPMKNGLEVTVEEIGKVDRSKYLLSLEHERNSHIYRGFWTAERLGKTKICVLFDENVVCEYLISARHGEDITKCRALGEGLERAVVGMPAKFLVDMKDAGKSKMEVAIKGPSEVEVKVNVMDNLNGLCTVEYIPETPGLYEIMVYYGDKKRQIPGSPFMIIADYERNPSKIVISGSTNGLAQARKPNSLIIDATLTALEPVSARLPAGFEQPIVEEIKPRVYRVTFIPSITSETITLELLYGDELLGKPIVFLVKPEEELESVVLRNRSGGLLPSTVQASLQFEALIDVTKAGKIDELFAEIKGPDGKVRKLLPTENSDKKIYLLDFVPDLVGVYVIVIYINGKPFSDPYNLTAIPVGSADKCFVESKSLDKFWTIGEPRVFVVNAKNGGKGALNVLCERADLEIKIDKNEDGSYTITLTPHTQGQHRVMLTYGGVDIPGGTFDFECVPPLVNEDRNVSKQPMESEDDGHLMPHSFRFSVTSEYQFNKLTASIKMPSGTDDIAYINDNRDGTVTVTYHPKECGSHLLSIKHDGINMSGSPISFYVNEANEEYATVYGLGLLQAVVGEPAAFTVCAKGSPTKELSVAIEGTAKAVIKCHDNKDGTCSVVWIPSMSGEYKVHVKLSGKPVKNSPFVVFVSNEDEKRAYLSLEPTAMSEILINIDSAEIEDLSASVINPSGIEEPCIIRQIDATHVGISFSPCEVGEHLITIKKNEHVIQKSNFQAEIIRNQPGEASKVVVSGTGKANAICQQDNSVLVNMRDAGYGDLSVSIQGPSEAELRCIENKEGVANIVYRPTEPGIYILSVKFAGAHINDSPFTINCTGKGMGIVKESANKKVKQVPVVLPGQDTALYLQLENVSSLDTKARVVDPNGYSKDVKVRDLGDDLYRIEFKPVVNGLHAVSILYKGQHVSGSPFQFTVGRMTEMGAHRVRAVGVGLKRAKASRKQSFNLYTREAGKGELEVTVEGPSKAELQFHEHEDGNCHFDYKVAKPGEYLISVKFNAEHIPDSPFKVFIAPAAGEVRCLELISLSDSGTPGEICAIMINRNGAKGHLKAKLHTPGNKIEAIDVLPIEGSDSYCVRFIPSETGDYYVGVTLDGAPMHDSPFCFRIGTNGDNDPSIITVTGDGIHGGQTGQICTFIINTCNAGTGLLYILISGPSKVTMNACEVSRLFIFISFHSVPGPYYVTIKYSGVHVPGSPFKVVVEGKKLDDGKPDFSLIKIDAFPKVKKEIVHRVPALSGDANKVIVKGPGLNKFFPGQSAIFNVDTGLAGDNILYVGLVTSKGPCEQVALQHLGNGQYVVKYLIQEEVKGFIYVKYGDVDVPGSPFAVSF
uniref:Calponin-homology (CH) domain-containing protein n=1 Tax=Wuchereria bancrofti TaxID=6293 RepID=A0AAF5PZP8_WUCBA